MQVSIASAPNSTLSTNFMQANGFTAEMVSSASAPNPPYPRNIPAQPVKKGKVSIASAPNPPIHRAV